MDCEVYVGGIHLEHISEFKYLGCILDESGTDERECSSKMTSGRRVPGAIRSLVRARDLKHESSRVLHETLLVPFLMYNSEVILLKEKERSRIRAVQMDNLTGLLGIRRMDIVPNTRVRELCGVTKGVGERIDVGVLRWFGHLERMENDRIAKRVYVGERAGSRSVGRPRKRKEV